MPLRLRPPRCPRCVQLLGLRKTFSTTGVQRNHGRNNNPPPPPASGYAPLPHRSLLQVSGPDTPKFLHGLLTSSVPAPTPGGFYSAFLTARGRVLYDVFVYPLPSTSDSSSSTSAGAGSVAADGAEEGFVVEVDAAEREGLLKHLKRHKLRSKVKLRALEDGEMGVYSVWREGERWNAYSLAQQQQGGEGSSVGSSHGVLSLLDQRAPGMGRRVLAPALSRSGSAALEGMEEFEGLEEAGPEQYRIRRYLRGVPEGQGEIIRDQTLPMACNLDLMGAIDFKKGCYVGQELTIRTHHTGVVRRRVLPVVLYKGEPPEKRSYDADWAEDAPSMDDDIKLEGKRGKPGKWISGVGNVGLAICRLEMMTDLMVTGEPGTYSSDDRFTIAVGPSGRETTVGVKAFIPDWMRGKIRAPKAQKRVES